MNSERVMATKDCSREKIRVARVDNRKGGEAVKKTWLFLTFAVLACLLIAYAPVGETLGLLTATSDTATNVVGLSDDFSEPQSTIIKLPSKISKAAPSEESENVNTANPAEESVSESANQTGGEPSPEPVQQPEPEPAQETEQQPVTESTGIPDQEAEQQSLTESMGISEQEANKQPVTKSTENPEKDNAKDNANGEDAEQTDEPTG
jgi:outer membrane biosynthesis protein TonB